MVVKTSRIEIRVNQYMKNTIELIASEGKMNTSELIRQAIKEFICKDVYRDIISEEELKWL